MIKLKFVFLCWTLVQVSADRPDWYPENASEVHRKCRAQYPLTPDIVQQINKRQLIDSSAMRSMLLCTAKDLHVFTSDKGFDVERLAFSMYRGSNRKCNRQLVRECVANNKEIHPEGALVFNVIKCILDVEFMKEDDDMNASGCDYNP